MLLKIAEDKKCDICGKENKECLEVIDEGLFFDSKIYICQSCVSKWFRAFDKKK